MDNRLSFGIGCFHFGVRRAPPFRFEGSEYLRELRTALESIPNIDRVSIQCEEEFETVSIDVKEEPPSIQSGPDFFPIPLYMRIEFEVYMPLRIQAQLLKEEIATLETFTERFKISIHYTYDLPVTFVEPVSPSQESTASEAVKILREFLIREFEDSKSEYIRFECLGPSPFHANCHVQPGKPQGDDQADWVFKASHVPQRGYGDVVFEFNPGLFAEAREARDAIMEEIIHELGFFYRIRQTEVVKLYDWMGIRHLVDRLIAIQRMKWFRGFLERLFVCPLLVNEALTAIAEFQANEFDSRHYMQSGYRQLISDTEELYFQAYVENEIEERMSYPTGEIRELISFFESRRARSVEALVVLGSAAIGGVIGGVLTILLSN